MPTTLANILDDAETHSMLVKLGVGAGWAIWGAAGGAAGHDPGRVGALVEVSQQCALRCAMGLHEKQVHHSARATLQRDTLICLRASNCSSDRHSVAAPCCQRTALETRRHPHDWQQERLQPMHAEEEPVGCPCTAQGSDGQCVPPAGTRTRCVQGIGF